MTADALLKNHKVSVTDTITSIDKDFLGSPYVRIGKCVVKYFPTGSDKMINGLTAGERTTLTGICDGRSLGIIAIKEK